MSSFILYQASRAENAIQRFSESSLLHNHKLHKIIDLGENRIALFGDGTGTDTTFFQAENGDFIAVLGSLLFDGDPAPACLERLLTSFDPDTFSWKGLLGTHVILIYKNGPAECSRRRPRRQQDLHKRGQLRLVQLVPGHAGGRKAESLSTRRPVTST